MKPFKYCPRCGTELLPTERGDQVRPVCPACDFVHWNNPTPVVAAVLEHSEGMILVHNHGWPAKWFGLVTGFLEAREDPEAAVLREVKEELGLTGELVRFIGLYPFEQMNQLIIAYYVRAEGNINLGEELAAYKAIPKDKLRPWPVATGHAVRDWLLQERLGGA